MSKKKKNKGINPELFFIIGLIVTLIIVLLINFIYKSTKFNEEYFKKESLKYVEETYGFKAKVLNCKITYEDDDVTGINLSSTSYRNYKSVCKMKKGNKTFNVIIKEYTAKNNSFGFYETINNSKISDTYKK